MLDILIVILTATGGLVWLVWVCSFLFFAGEWVCKKYKEVHGD